MSEIITESLQHYGRTDDLKPILSEAIINPFTKEIIEQDVEAVLAKMDAALAGEGETFYAVARTAELGAVGIMGIRPVGLTTQEDPMRRYVTQNPAAEIINAYTRKAARGQGVGRALLGALEAEAAQRGFRQTVLNSGPRFARSGWPFWRAVYGPPVDTAMDFYGPRFHAPIWRHDLPSV